MTTAREAFLQRVREAVAAGNRAGDSAPLPPRGQTGYQGAGADPAACFRDALEVAGGYGYLLPDREAAVVRLQELLQGHSLRRVLLGRGDFLDSLDLGQRLAPLGLEITRIDTIPPESVRDVFFAADVGISGVDYLIAETGSVVMRARTNEPRSLTLLPPVHIAVAERRQILPDLFDLFDPRQVPGPPPSGLTLITGPSKTGDIELRLVTGVHGPGELHVLVVGC